MGAPATRSVPVCSAHIVAVAAAITGKVGLKVRT